VASGQGDARASLHEALEGFGRARLPMEVARTRLELARALAERSPGAPIRTGLKGIGATVETHVGNLLAKLGLRNRAEAVAYVTRRSARHREPPRYLRRGCPASWSQLAG
jgi:regulatory LuxR family protein